MNIPSSPSKRSRVAFNDDVEIVSDDDELDPLLVKEQVRRAIERHLNYDHESYEKIRAVFASAPDVVDAPSNKVLKVHLQALLANVSKLGRECNGLVNSVIFSEWVGRDDAFVALFVRFLGNLAAAQGGYVNKIMGMLVDLLGTQKTRHLPDMKRIRQPRIHRRVLESMRYIAQLVPAASSALADRLAAKLNFDFQKADERMTYIKSFMDLIQYVPELTSEILANVLRQLIKLDTSIQVDLDNEDDDLEDEIMQHMTSSQTLAYNSSQQMAKEALTDEEDDLSSSDESESDEEDDMDPVATRKRKLKEDVKQVDMIMDILFQYYAELTSSPNLQIRDNAVEQLIAQFNSMILPTYRSRHPQFLVFHFAQSDPMRVDRFVTNCIGILLDQRLSHVVRHAAAAYFAGFVGRGANVAPTLVHDCVDLLCSQLNELRKKYEPQCRLPDLKRFGDFYAMFQAVMYIFCFRWKDIGSALSDMDDESDLDDENGQDYHLSPAIHEAIRAAVYSRLNPLRVCTPAIVEQFAKLSNALQVLYVYPKLEENKRVRVATSWRSLSDIDINQPDRDLSWLGDNGMLEGYFPYDPYHLPISRHWIEGDYVEWRGIPGEEAAEDSDAEAGDFDTLEDMDADEIESDEA